MTVYIWALLSSHRIIRVPHFVYLPEEQGVQAIKKGEIDADNAAFCAVRLTHVKGLGNFVHLYLVAMTPLLLTEDSLTCLVSGCSACGCSPNTVNVVILNAP